MPNIADIVEVAQALESKAVYADAKRCVAVRNRNAKCTKCADACPSGAITVGQNKLELDSGVCVACGACTVVCPVEALIPLRPLDADLAQSIADAVVTAETATGAPSGKKAVFACARISSKRQADPDTYAEVPCLARMEESVLMGLASLGVAELVLVDGTCSTCKYRFCDEGITATVDSANTLLAAMGSAARVSRSSAFPDDLRIEDATGKFGVSRRGFFSQARGAAKEAAEKTVVTALKKDDGKQKQTLRDRLGMSESGGLPQFEAVRRMLILDAMDRLGEPAAPEMQTRLWGRVSIDANACNSCKMCSVFCPTGAIRLVEDEEEKPKGPAKRKAEEDGETVFEFTLSECVQCMVCQDICLKKCLTVSDCIPTAELFDFEPVELVIPKKAARKNLLSNLKP